MDSEMTTLYPTGVRVLLVDDDVRFLKAASMLLSLLNFQVSTCHSLNSALRFLTAGDKFKEIDVVLADAAKATTCGFDFRAIVEPDLRVPVLYFLSTKHRASGEEADALLRILDLATFILKKPLEGESVCCLWRNVAWRKLQLKVRASLGAGADDSGQGSSSSGSGSSGGGGVRMLPRSPWADRDDEEEERVHYRMVTGVSSGRKRRAVSGGAGNPGSSSGSGPAAPRRGRPAKKQEQAAVVAVAGQQETDQVAKPAPRKYRPRKDNNGAGPSMPVIPETVIDVETYQPTRRRSFEKQQANKPKKKSRYVQDVLKTLADVPPHNPSAFAAAVDPSTNLINFSSAGETGSSIISFSSGSGEPAAGNILDFSDAGKTTSDGARAPSPAVSLAPTAPASPAFVNRAPTAPASPAFVNRAPTAPASPALVNRAPTAAASPAFVNRAPTAPASPALVNRAPTAPASPALVNQAPQAPASPGLLPVVQAPPAPPAPPLLPVVQAPPSPAPAVNVVAPPAAGTAVSAAAAAVTEKQLCASGSQEQSQEEKEANLPLLLRGAFGPFPYQGPQQLPVMQQDMFGGAPPHNFAAGNVELPNQQPPAFAGILAGGGAAAIGGAANAAHAGSSETTVDTTQLQPLPLSIAAHAGSYVSSETTVDTTKLQPLPLSIAAATDNELEAMLAMYATGSDAHMAPQARHVDVAPLNYNNNNLNNEAMFYNNNNPAEAFTAPPRQVLGMNDDAAMAGGDAFNNNNAEAFTAPPHQVLGMNNDAEMAGGHAFNNNNNAEPFMAPHQQVLSMVPYGVNNPAMAGGNAFNNVNGNAAALMAPQGFGAEPNMMNQLVAADAPLAVFDPSVENEDDFSFPLSALLGTDEVPVYDGAGGLAGLQGGATDNAAAVAAAVDAADKFLNGGEGGMEDWGLAPADDGAARIFGDMLMEYMNNGRRE